MNANLGVFRKFVFAIGVKENVKKTNWFHLSGCSICRALPFLFMLLVSFLFSGNTNAENINFDKKYENGYNKIPKISVSKEIKNAIVSEISRLNIKIKIDNDILYGYEGILCKKHVIVTMIKSNLTCSKYECLTLFFTKEKEHIKYYFSTFLKPDVRYFDFMSCNIPGECLVYHQNVSGKICLVEIDNGRGIGLANIVP